MPKAKRKRIQVTLEHFNRLNDRYVKFVFSNPENKPLLIGLINEVSIPRLEHQRSAI